MEHEGKRRRRARQGDGRARRASADAAALAWPSWWRPPGCPGPPPTGWPCALEAHGLVRRDDDGRFALGLPAGRPRPRGRRRLAAGRGGPARAGALRDDDRRERAALRARRRPPACASPRSSRPTSCARSSPSAPGCRSTGARPAGSLAGRRRAARPARRWVESVEEREPGVASVSAPVPGPDGRCSPRSACPARSSAPPAAPAAATAPRWSPRPAGWTSPPATDSGVNRSPWHPTSSRHAERRQAVARHGGRPMRSASSSAGTNRAGSVAQTRVVAGDRWNDSAPGMAAASRRWRPGGTRSSSSVTTTAVGTSIVADPRSRRRSGRAMPPPRAAARRVCLGRISSRTQLGERSLVEPRADHTPATQALRQRRRRWATSRATAARPGSAGSPPAVRRRSRSAVAHSTSPATRSRWRCQSSWATGRPSSSRPRSRPGRCRARREGGGVVGAVGQAERVARLRMPRPWPGGRWRPPGSAGQRRVAREPVEVGAGASSRAAAAPWARRPGPASSRTKVVPPARAASTVDGRAAADGAVRRR